MMELPEGQTPSEPQDEGLIAKIQAALSKLNPFAKIAEAMEPPVEKAPKDPMGLLKGRSTDVFNENVRILRSRGVSEADAVRIARESMMRQ